MIPRRPNCRLRRSVRRSWSTVSNAAIKSSKHSADTCSLSAASNKSLKVKVQPWNGGCHSLVAINFTETCGKTEVKWTSMQMCSIYSWRQISFSGCEWSKNFFDKGGPKTLIWTTGSSGNIDCSVCSCNGRQSKKFWCFFCWVSVDHFKASPSVTKHLKSPLCLIHFTHSVNKMFVSNSKSHCCSMKITDVQFILLLAKSI